MLLERGADANERYTDEAMFVHLPELTNVYTEYGRTPMMALAFSAWVSGTALNAYSIIQTVNDTIRVLIEVGNCDPMIGNDKWSSAFACWLGPPECFDYLRSHELVAIDEAEWLGAGSRWSVYHNHILSVPHEVIKDHTARQRWLKVLWRPKDAPNLSTMRYLHGTTILHFAMFKLATRDLDEEQAIAYIFEITRRLLAGGADVHANDDKGMTPLGALLSFSIPDEEYSNVTKGKSVDISIPSDGTLKKQEHLVRSWLSLLREQGFDIEEYLEMERPRALRYERDNVEFTMVPSLETDGSLEKVHIDWDFSWVDLNMPGSWQDSY